MGSFPFLAGSFEGVAVAAHARRSRFRLRSCSRDRVPQLYRRGAWRMRRAMALPAARAYNRASAVVPVRGGSRNEWQWRTERHGYDTANAWSDDEVSIRCPLALTALSVPE
jgi:hypothetical protein